MSDSSDCILKLNCGFLEVAPTLYCITGHMPQDIGLLVKMGTRRAIFPNQRLAPLLNVAACLDLTEHFTYQQH